MEHTFVMMKLPKLTNPDLAEETGIHVGDGSMNVYGKGSHMFSLRGHRFDDQEYYENFIPKLYKRVFGLDVNIRYWPDVIGFQKGSKELLQFKRGLGLPMGPKGDLGIPKFVLRNKRLLARFIRGIFDTDSTLTFEKKSRDIPYYPRIIISTTSHRLGPQLVGVLSKKFGFNLSHWVDNRNHKNWRDIHRICIRGEKNTKKWFKVIGSSNPKNVVKYKYWEIHGYAPVAQPGRAPDRRNAR